MGTIELSGIGRGRGRNVCTVSDVRVAGTQSVRRAKRSATGVVEVIRHMGALPITYEYTIHFFGNIELTSFVGEPDMLHRRAQRRCHQPGGAIG